MQEYGSEALPLTRRPSAAALSHCAGEGRAFPSPAYGRRQREAPDEGLCAHLLSQGSLRAGQPAFFSA